MALQQLLNHITAYLDYLKNTCKLSISVHFDEKTSSSLFKQAISALLPYNSHTNPYCMAVKKDRHNKCLLHQTEILQGVAGSFLRVCHAGVFEYIHVFRSNGKSGYRRQPPPDSCGGLWQTALSGDVPLETLNAVIPPLGLMLERLFDCPSESPENEYNLIVQFLSEFHSHITLDDLCAHFGRSKSHISHMFKTASGMSIREYCNKLKLEDAEKLLKETAFSVTEIAFETGFNDTSYFIRLFSQKYGVTPLQYRKANSGSLPHSPRRFPE
ncbi:MAG: AraC family transcriptional regulator [Clostridiales bacterium]|nr:AraC family transcriptional regulator [Clostridiales bacterium]